MFVYFGAIIILVVVSVIIVMYVGDYWGRCNRYCSYNWISSFECGFLSHGFSEKFFSYTYMNMLLIFVVFDLEVSLLLNVPFDEYFYNSYVYYIFFIGVVCVGYLFEVYKSYVCWSR